MRFENLDLEIGSDLEQQILYSAIEDDIEKNIQQSKNLNNSRKKKKSKKIEKRLKSGLQIKTVLLLLLTLIVNTYAWFIYISTVSTGLSMHVKSWEFELSSGEQNQDFMFVVDQIYPGMEEAEQVIDAKNNGETDASLTCEVVYVRILDTIYETEKDYTDEDGNIFQYTSNDLINKISNDYPFKIQIYINDTLYDGEENIMQTGDSTQIKFKVNWEYETGTTENEISESDKNDTYWGNESYKYMQTNPDKYTIEIKLNIQAVQHNDDSSTTP